MWQTLAPWLADLLALFGTFIISIGVYGMVRMPGLYTRLHAASKAVFLGVIPLLVAAALIGEGEMLGHVVLVGVFLLLTTPVGAHAIGRAAYLEGKRMATPEAVDESGRLSHE